MVFIPQRPAPPSPPLPEIDLTAELRVNRLNTSVFISQSPKRIELRTRERVKLPTGGHTTTEGLTRLRQTFRLIQQSPSGASIEQRTEDGSTERRVDYILLGEWDAEVDVGDFWAEGGSHFEVMSMIPWNGYEVRANVEATGRRP